MNHDSVSEHIAEFIVNGQINKLPENLATDLQQVMKLSILDYCSVALAGRNEPVSRIVRQLVRNEGGAAQALVIGEEQDLPLRAAALANGTTAHALDYDDTHFMHVGHTSVAVLPAALALAQSQEAFGQALIDAAIIGSEVACHVGSWLGRAHYQAGFHQTATAGTFGAVAASARLLKLDRLQTRHALGLASTRASGLKNQFGTMGKPYNAGIAAMNGVEVTLLAAAGFESRIDGIECVQGFAQTHHAQQTGDADCTRTGLEALGQRFVFTDVQHKLHACCHGLHAAIEALRELQRDHDVPAADVQRIQIRTNPRWIGVCDKAQPATGLEAKFSYAFVSAAVISHIQTADLTTFTTANCSTPALQQLIAKTNVVADGSLTDTQASVEVTLMDGRQRQAFHDIAATRPVSERQQAVLEKSAILLGHPTSEALWAVIDTLQDNATHALIERLRAINAQRIVQAS